MFIQDQTDPKTYEPKRLVVDGQRRIRTVLAFVDIACLSDRQDSDSFTVLRMHNADVAGKRFLCADLDLTLEPREDHAAYIANWLDVLRADNRAIVTAASHAQRAADFINRLQPADLGWRRPSPGAPSAWRSTFLYTRRDLTP